MAGPTDVAGSDTPTVPSPSDLLATVKRASHFMEPASFLETEAANQGLGQATSPTLVKTPPADARRAGGYPIDSQLGVLARLQGTWIGNGFNVISRPDKQNDKLFFLQMNATIETLQFTPITAPIPNRGSKQGDISFLGLTYLQQINDAQGKGALHLEPGIWINVPATTAPMAPASIVRLSTIPHGNSLLAQGKGFKGPGAPVITEASTIPVEESGKPIPLEGYTDEFFRPDPPPGIPPNAVVNPNLLLSEALQGQTITETTVLMVTTTPPGGIENIPFLTTNANAISMTAVFWIETLKLPDGSNQLQLQYTQTVVLNFDEINWPHVSVATLYKR